MLCSMAREQAVCWAQLDLSWAQLTLQATAEFIAKLFQQMNCRKSFMFRALIAKTVRARAVWMDQRAKDGLDTVRHHQCHAIFQLRESQWEKTAYGEGLTTRLISTIALQYKDFVLY